MNSSVISSQRPSTAVQTIAPNGSCSSTSISVPALSAAISRSANGFSPTSAISRFVFVAWMAMRDPTSHDGAGQ